MSLRLALRSALLACWLWPSAPAAAHPVHASDAEIDVRAECRCLEVALRVAPEDLEESLARLTGARRPLEADAIDAVLLSYLRERFVVTAPDVREPKAPKAIEWIGKEVGAREAWLYFKVLDVGTTFDLTDRILFEHEPSQVNRVVVRSGGRKRTLTFHAGDGAERVAVGEPSPAARANADPP